MNYPIPRDLTKKKKDIKCLQSKEKKDSVILQ